MRTEPIPGQSYRIVQHPTHQGRVGVASNVQRRGRVWELTLSNIREWGAAGIATEVNVLSSEIEPAESPAPIGALGAGEMRDFTERSRALREDLRFPSNLAQPAAKPDTCEGPEHELVGEITRALESAGYRVAVVGQLKAKGSGTTTGYPDMSARHPSWPQGMACLIEVKVGSNGLTPEQADLYLDGWSHVARCIEDAFRAVEICAGAVSLCGEGANP